MNRFYTVVTGFPKNRAIGVMATHKLETVIPAIVFYCDSKNSWILLEALAVETSLVKLSGMFQQPHTDLPLIAGYDLFPAVFFKSVPANPCHYHPRLLKPIRLPIL